MRDQSETEILDSVACDYREMLESSKQPIILFLDEENQLSDGHFARLLGYKSMDERSAQGSVLDGLDEESSEALKAAHQ